MRSAHHSAIGGVFGAALILAAGCSAITSFDNFVGEGSTSSSSSTSGSAGTTTSSTTTSSSSGTSGTTSGGTSGTSSGTSSSGTTSSGGDAGTDAGPCTIKQTGQKTGSIVGQSGSGPAWTNASNALVADNASAQSTPTALNDETAFLRVTGFNLGLPVGVSIRGVRVYITRRQATGADIRERDFRLIVNDTLQGESRSRGDNLPTSYQIGTYGGPTDLWGVAGALVNVMNFNPSSFGVAIQMKTHGGVQGPVEIDEIKMDVTYCQ